MKKSFFLFAVLYSVTVCGVANAGNESLPGIYHILFLAVKTTAGPSVSGTSATATTLSVTINKNGTGYYLVRLALEVEPTVAEVLAGTSFAMTANTPAAQPITGLTVFTAYKLYFIAKSSSSKVQGAVQNVALATSCSAPLNDTGITWGGSYPSGNNAGCTGEEIGAQDCSHGRDFTNNDNSDGHAGFSFTKLDASGLPLVFTCKTKR